MNPLYERLARWQPRWSEARFRATLVSLFVVALATPIVIIALPFNEFMNDMAAQPKAKTQMTYGRRFDPEGFGHIAARDPVPGTLPRGFAPYPLASLGKDPQAIARAGELLKNPLPTTLAHMQAGQQLFKVYCAVCHGPRGLGDGPVTGEGRFPTPPSLHTDKARQYADGSIFHIITQGTEIMPSYADKLDPEERWQVIEFVRALQRAEHPRPEDLK